MSNLIILELDEKDRNTRCCSGTGQKKISVHTNKEWPQGCPASNHVIITLFIKFLTSGGFLFSADLEPLIFFELQLQHLFVVLFLCCNSYVQCSFPALYWVSLGRGDGLDLKATLQQWVGEKVGSGVVWRTPVGASSPQFVMNIKPIIPILLAWRPRLEQQRLPSELPNWLWLTWT